MNTTPHVRTRIIPIGNSQGVRVPKTLLEQSGLEGEVELLVDRGRIVIQSAESPRHGWDDAFKAMAAEGTDRLLDEDRTGTSAWDDEEWEW